MSTTTLAQIEYMDEYTIGKFCVESGDWRIYKLGGYVVTYERIIVAARTDPKTNFEQIFKKSTGSELHDQMNEIANYCGGKVVEDEMQCLDGNFRKTSYLVVTSREQFRKAVEWLEPRMLAWEILKASRNWKSDWEILEAGV